jgi:hypothetical protein
MCQRASKQGCVRTDGAARVKVKVVLVVLADMAHGWLRGQRVCVCPLLSAHAFEAVIEG